MLSGKSLASFDIRDGEDVNEVISRYEIVAANRRCVDEGGTDPSSPLSLRVSACGATNC